MSKVTKGRPDLVILETDFRGHRMSFVRHVVDFSSVDRQIAIASSTEALTSEEFALRFPECSDVDTIDVGPLVLPKKSGYRRYVSRTLDLIRHQVGPKAQVLLMEGDPALVGSLFWPRRRFRQLTILIIRPPRLFDSVRGLLKLCLMLLARARGARIVCLLPARPVAARYRHGPFYAAPDPIDLHLGSPSSRQGPAPIDPSLRTVGIFGNIGLRKNPGLVAKAMLAIDQTVGHQLLLAGKVAPEVCADAASPFAAFQAAGGTLTVVDRLLSDQELDGLVSDVDLAVFAHTGDGPSQILGKALALGVPVLAAGSRVLRRELRRLEVGRWAPLTVEGISRALSDESTFRPGPRTDFANGREFARALVD